MGQEKSVEDLVFNKAVKHVTSDSSATYTLTKLQRTCIVDATSDDAGTDIIIYLPPPDQCFGLFVHVVLTTHATEDVLVKDKHHQTETLATLDTSLDECVLYSTGYEWVPVGGTYT